MSEKYKDVLISSKVLLSRNIVWTDEFAAQLKDRNITSDSMLKDLKDCENREQRVIKLLEFVSMRGQQGYQKFCDILQVTGHYFLADFLRDEENRTDVPDAKEIYKKLPFLEKVLKDNEKSRLESYIIEKIKEEVLREVWKKESEEKDKTLTAKEKQLNQTFAFEEERKVKESAIAHLESDIQDVSDELVDYKSQVRALSNTLLETEDNFKTDLDKQIKFNLANESSLKRSQNYVKQLEDTLQAVRARLGEVVVFKQKSSMKEQVSEAGFKFAHIMDDIECVVVKIEELNSLQKKHAALLEEREWILMHLGYPPNDPDTPSMVEAYREFAVRTDENIHFLQQEVAKYTELLKQRESTGVSSLFIGQPVQASHRDDIWKGTIISVLKKETHDMRAKLGNRDRKIVQLEKDIISLKSSLKSLRFHGNNTKRSSSRNGKRQYTTAIVKPTEDGSNQDAIKLPDVNDGPTLQLPRLPITNNFMDEKSGPFLVHSLDPFISAKRLSIDLSPEKLLNNSPPRISYPNGLRPGHLNGVVDPGQRKSITRSHFDMKQAFGDLENMQNRNKYLFGIQSKAPTVKNKKFLP